VLSLARRFRDHDWRVLPVLSLSTRLPKQASQGLVKLAAEGLSEGLLGAHVAEIRAAATCATSAG
jgi:hypothetical protein